MHNLQADSSSTQTALDILKGPTWRVGGYVLVCSDTANMIIVADGKERFLITPERVELMSPTKPCFQTGMEKLARQMREDAEPQLPEFTD